MRAIEADTRVRSLHCVQVRNASQEDLSQAPFRRQDVDDDGIAMKLLRGQVLNPAFHHVGMAS